MHRNSAAAAAIVLLVACATQELPPPGTGLLDAKEQQALAAIGDATDGERFRVLRLPPSVGLVRWDPDRSTVGPSCPENLLQRIRDEAGRLNQKPKEGTALKLTVRVDSCAPETLFRPPVVRYAFVLGSAESNRSLVIGAGELDVASDLFESPADDRAVVVGRELRRRVERGLERLNSRIQSRRTN
jgi:hypothetical protein